MGGPFWSRKDAGAWSVIKGLVEAGESPLQAARREFTEETGLPAPAVDREDAGDFTQPSGKIVTVYLARVVDLPTAITGNTFEMEWPPRSGGMQSFPEIDRGGWFALDVARLKLIRGLVPVIDVIASRLHTMDEHAVDERSMDEKRHDQLTSAPKSTEEDAVPRVEVSRVDDHTTRIDIAANSPVRPGRAAPPSD
jgi:predicted NUDIX family NTP pyrophosphohydrolase